MSVKFYIDLALQIIITNFILFQICSLGHVMEPFNASLKGINLI